MAGLPHRQPFQGWTWPFQRLPLPSGGDRHDVKGMRESCLRPLQSAVHAAVVAPTWFCGSITWKAGPRLKADGHCEAPVNNCLEVWAPGGGLRACSLSWSLIGTWEGCLGRGAEGSHGPASHQPACHGPGKHDSISDLSP